MRKILLILVGTLVYMSLYAQFTTGTTGLLNMPTAEMQRDKTFMFGGGFLEKHATPARWTYNTLNYYINITLFPWLEVAYDCTLHKAMKCDPVYGCGFWVPSTYGKFVNQDRNFSVRLRLLKEGQWWKYMPAIVIGSNDVTTRPVMTVVQTFQIRRGQVMDFGTAISLSQLNIWHLRIWES